LKAPKWGVKPEAESYFGIESLEVERVLNETACVLVDVQEKLWRVMHEREAVLEHLEKFLRALRVLEVPIVWMEQVPEKLGSTISVLQELLSDQQPIAKATFSGYADPNVRSRVETLGRKHLLLAGIEAHVCVYQTAVDLLDAGYSVSLVSDAITSRTAENKAIGLEMARARGASLTSVETILFEFLRSAQHPAFREIIEIVK